MRLGICRRCWKTKHVNFRVRFHGHYLFSTGAAVDGLYRVNCVVEVAHNQLVRSPVQRYEGAVWGILESLSVTQMSVLKLKQVMF